MAWWIWVVAGAALLAAEVVVATDFYLVFLGISAVVVGLLGLFGLSLPAWLQFLLFAVLAAVLTLLYRRRWKPRLTVADREMGPEMVGEVGTARGAMTAGSRGRITLRGAAWDAVNDGESEIAAGAHCVVTRVTGLTLHVRAEDRS